MSENDLKTAVDAKLENAPSDEQEVARKNLSAEERIVLALEDIARSQRVIMESTVAQEHTADAMLYLALTEHPDVELNFIYANFVSLYSGDEAVTIEDVTADTKVKEKVDTSEKPAPEDEPGPGDTQTIDKEKIDGGKTEKQ